MSDIVRMNALRAVEFDGVSLDPLRTSSVRHRALVAQLWGLAGDVGALRREGGPAWMCDRASGRIDVALSIVCPSAAELIASGVEVEAAIEVAEERGRRLRRLAGEPW